jgi:adhesin transport system membrane fusion protein
MATQDTNQKQPIDTSSEREIGKLVVDYAKRLANEFRIDNLLTMLTEFSKDLVQSDRATIWMIDEEEQQLFTKVAQGIGDLSELRIPINAGAVGHAVVNDKLLVINDAYSSDLFNPEMDKKTGYKTECILVVPVKDNNGKIIGAVQTINKQEGLEQKYTEQDLSNLEIAGSYIATIIEKILFKVRDALLTKKMSQLNNVFDEHITFIVLDRDFQIQKTSTSFQNIFDFKEDDVREKPIIEIVVNEDRSKFNEGLEFVSNNTDQDWSNEIEFMKKNEKPIWMNTVVHPDVENDKLNGYTLLLDDITDKKLVEMYKIEQLKSRDYDKSLLEFMGSVTSTVLQRTSRSLSLLTKALMGTIFFLLTYAYFAELDELSRGDGKVIPIASVQTIQNLEGGIVQQLFVSEGDVVKKGDPLVQLNDVTFLSAISENRIKIEELKAKVKRLRAEAGIEEFVIEESTQKATYDDILKLADQADDSDMVQASSQPDSLKEFKERITKAEFQLYKTNQSELNSKMESQREKITQKRNDIRDLKVKLNNSLKNYEILKKEIVAKKPLVNRKIFSKTELYKLEREANDLQSQIRNTREQINNAKSVISETENTIEEIKLGYVNEAQMEYNASLSEIASLQANQKSLKDKLSRTLIKSPVDGMVKEVFVKTVGGVLQGGKELMNIIPTDDRLLCEIKVKTEDIAKVYIGQPVHLKFTAFDPNLYGGLEGEVTFVSPDTTSDERAQKTYYVIHVKAAKNYVGEDERYNKLKPGMIVNAEMVLGKKSILDFILKPIMKDNYTEYTEH